MTLLLSCQSISKSVGARSLFKNLSFPIFQGDRLGLMGANGSGKSTLLKILAALDSADSGQVAAKKGVRIGYVAQREEFEDLPPKAILLSALQNVEMAEYEKEVIASKWLSKMGFTDQVGSASLLSGGWKKRLSLARELMVNPDLLLLDEPTNHLDLEGILWLEKFLAQEAPTYLLISHDRTFLQNTTNRLIELSSIYPEGFFSVHGEYHLFLERRAEFLEGQIKRERALASKARKESQWLRTSPKARTTKAQSRIDSANELLQELSLTQDRNRQRVTPIDFVASERETKKLLVGKNLSLTLGNKRLFSHLDLTLSPTSRIGLMGPNGSGKTSLLRLLNEEIRPDGGSLKRADQLKVVYFDQHRNKLDDRLSLKQALSPNGDYVCYRGSAIHINGWCKRFLFPPSALDMPIKELSGGERARIAIAHLMLQPADVLLLDEPTNDLDIPTLEMMEESLLEFTGAVVLITHDRSMLERLCRSVLVFGEERICEYADYRQWENSLCREPNTKRSSEGKERGQRAKRVKAITYAEKRELEQIEQTIVELEKRLEHYSQLLQELAQEPIKLQEICQASALAQLEIDRLYSRWEELDRKNSYESSP